MKKIKLVYTLLFLLLSIEANSEIEVQDILAISKMTGACGVMQQMVSFQKSTKMPGGDEFIERFWATEVTRLGKTTEQFFKECEQSIQIYETLWNVEKEKNK